MRVGRVAGMVAAAWGGRAVARAVEVTVTVVTGRWARPHRSERDGRRGGGCGARREGGGNQMTVRSGKRVDQAMH